MRLFTKIFKVFESPEPVIIKIKHDNNKNENT